MSVHDAFFKHLGPLPGGVDLQAAYETYKNAPNGEPFALNGYLKAVGVEIPDNLIPLDPHHVPDSRLRADLVQ